MVDVITDTSAFRKRSTLCQFVLSSFIFNFYFFIYFRHIFPSHLQKDRAERNPEAIKICTTCCFQEEGEETRWPLCRDHGDEGRVTLMKTGRTRNSDSGRQESE